MIVHYKQGTTDFLGMDNIITPLIVHCEIEREINGIFNAEILVIKDSEMKYEEIKVLDFIKIPTPNGEQLFRIIDKDDTATHSVTFFCRHLFFDLQQRLIKDTFIQQRNGTQALQQILNNLDETTQFTAFSDITELNNLRLVRTKGIDAILGGNKDNYLIERYKGEIDVDNYKIKLLKKLGTDKGYEIREGKNLTGYDYKEDSNELCTRLMPVLFDGILIPESYVDSPNIDKYDIVHTNTIKFDDIKLKERLDDGTIKPDNSEEDYINEGYNTEEDMFAEARKRCKELFGEGLDKIRVQAAVKFIDLSKTEQYKDFAFLHRLDLGDTVHFILEKYNIKVAERIVSYRYNALTEEYIELEIGHAQDSIFSSNGSMNGTGGSNNGIGSGDGAYDSNLGIEFDKWYDKVINDATDLIHGGMKNSHVLVRENEVLVMDTKDITTTQSLWRWNNGGFGHGKEGYNGKFTTAITADGQFVINEATCRKFTGDLIEAGTIQANRLSVEAKGEITKGLVTQSSLNVALDEINLNVGAVEESVKQTNTIVSNNLEESKKHAEKVATAKADLAKAEAEAYADGIVDDEEQARIDEAKKNLETAINAAKDAENNSKEYSKTEIKKMDDKVAKIDLKADGINSTVKKQQEQITEIDGEVKEKITLEEAKAEINHKADELTTTVSSSGGENIIDDSDLRTENLGIWNEYKFEWRENTTTEILLSRDAWALNDVNVLRLYCQNAENGEYGVDTKIKVNKNQIYTFSVLCATHRADAKIFIYNPITWEWLGNDLLLENDNKTGGKDSNGWKLLKITFNSGDLEEIGIKMCMTRATLNGVTFLGKMMLNEGSLALKHNVKGYSGSYVEQKLTSDSLVASVNDGLADGKKVEVAGFTLDKAGFSTFDKGRLSTRMTDFGLFTYSFLYPDKVTGGFQSMKDVTYGFDTSVIHHNWETASMIAYKKGDGTYGVYTLYDKSSRHPTTKYAINHYEGVDHKANLNIDNRMYFGWSNVFLAYSRISRGHNLGFFNNANGSWFATIGENGTLINTDLHVYGNKNCIQRTENFGDVKFYATEDTSSLLTDTKTDYALETSLDSNGEYTCKVLIEELIQETINTEMMYNVYVDKLSFGDYMIAEKDRHKDYFIIKSDKPLKFKYKLEGRRKGFEQERKTFNARTIEILDVPFPEEKEVEYSIDIPNEQLEQLYKNEYQHLYYRTSN